MPQNTPEGRGQQSHNAADHIQTEMGFVKKGPDGLAPERNPDVQAKERVHAVEKKLKPLATTVTKKKEEARPFFPTAEEQAQMKIVFDQVIAEAGRSIDPRSAINALSATLDLLTATPQIREVPSKELLDAIDKIGQANRNLAKENAEQKAKFDELAKLFIQMKATYEKQQAAPVVPAQMPNFVINNNLAPQNGPQAPAPAVEKKVEQKGWEDEGRSLMYQVASINQRIKILKDEHDQRLGSVKDPVAEKAFIKEAEALISQRKQLLRTVNSVIESARKPSDDRNQIAATPEETIVAMNRWLNDMGQNRGGLTVLKGGEYKVM